MQQKYRLTIAYDGTRFFGWERQPGKDTIQGKLEAVLGELQGAPVNVIGAGRTDAGVHARAMTANVVLDTALTPEEIRDYMNRYLPDAIAVREVKEAAPRFHARYNALGKTYRYTCHVGAVKPVFDRKYVTLLDYEPDVERMRLAAAYLLGEQDFASFCGNPRMKKSTVRMVDHIGIEQRRDRVIFTFHGTGFLQNMVRILVGTLLEVGRGYWEPEYVQEILLAKDRKRAGPILDHVVEQFKKAGIDGAKLRAVHDHGTSDELSALSEEILQGSLLLTQRLMAEGVPYSSPKVMEAEMRTTKALCSRLSAKACRDLNLVGAQGLAYDDLDAAARTLTADMSEEDVRKMFRLKIESIENALRSHGEKPAMSE